MAPVCGRWAPISSKPPDEIALTLLAMAFKAQPFALSELPEIDWVAKVRRELTPGRGRAFLRLWQP